MITPTETEQFYKKLGFDVVDVGGGFVCYQKIVNNQFIRVTVESELPKNLDIGVEAGIYSKDEEPIDVVFLENSHELPRFLKEISNRL